MAQDNESKITARPMRRLVLCCDGSWQSSSHGLRNVASNVAKLSRSIAGWTIENGQCIQQLVYYDAGVGTATSSVERDGNFIAKGIAKAQKCWEGGVGRGLEENVCEAYNFLVNNYLPGDEIYIFGFSRGAYTARALAGLVCNIGICLPDMMDDWWFRYAEYKLNAKNKVKDEGEQKHAKWSNMVTWSQTKPYTDYEERFHKDVEIEVVGVFDTVGALGVPTNIFVDVEGWNEKTYGFHDTKLHNQIKHAFHALALDDRRAPFTPTLWSRPPGVTTKLFQCWFPGCHINIGGGSDDTEKGHGDLEAMANLSLVWMIDQVRHRTPLAFEDHALARFYHQYTGTLIDLSRRGFTKGSTQYSYPPIKKGGWNIFGRKDVPDEKHITGYGGWGLGYRPDSFSLTYYPAGPKTRTPGQYTKANQQGDTKEFIHPVVRYARSESYQTANTSGSPLYYDPEALKGFNLEQDAKGEWCWRKFVRDGEHERLVVIREFRLWDDVDTADMLFNERDYMRADWLALLAPLKGFDEAFISQYLASAKQQQSTTNAFTAREQKLLEALTAVAAREHASTMKSGSLFHELRKCSFPGHEEQKLQRLKAAGARAKSFLDGVGTERYVPPVKELKFRSRQEMTDYYLAKNKVIVTKVEDEI
ncbi:T6SS phospholipase effector Tle1-like catalytic domain-containing protein [Aspergillus clavatus NRRL 1]|uniref:T6SS Phospholipase effector Tle1-like catalytic domain-containing protein n=1 Tax=Aspergillus clavatus (strain ATCC 1007 / CBS 513.65 / DSM 816 / NCTC 3887 / NRRL 1 / QM 1276 / 107) TaxID=344612 RepID=A1C4N2_ASPCL|nr:uncharacterized protein ACLA_060400 [Aspergillus clavatus NRRL 1]EAW15372.1 hypothetical protein ACLA_060400 [Aspergillus clavatus NRRL 1]